MNKYHWILDNGHGQNTKGKRSPEWDNGTQLLEYEFNRAIVLGISTGLDLMGYDNTILVPEILDTSLRTRSGRSNRLKVSKPKIGISIHGNGFRSQSANGIEVFTYMGFSKSDLFATELINSLKKELKPFKLTFRTDYTDGDADKEANLAILRDTNHPFVLSENGFMTNKKECALMLRQDYRKAVVMAHINAIVEFEER